MVSTRSRDLRVPQNSPIESTMVEDPIEIKHCVQISGGGLGRRVTIPHELLKQDSGVTYIHCSTVPKCIASLFVGRGNGGGVEERRFSRTNVFEVITKLRNAKIDEHTQPPEPQETLIICGGNNKPKRVSADKKLEALVSIEVDAPAFGEVQGIAMRVMMGWKKSAPLFIELNQRNIAYLRDACQYQLDSGEIKRTRIKKRLTECVSNDNISDESQDGGLQAQTSCEADILEHAMQSPLRESPESAPIDPSHRLELTWPSLVETPPPKVKRFLISDFF